jgi:hypothetical protein
MPELLMRIAREIEVRRDDLRVSGHASSLPEVARLDAAFAAIQEVLERPAAALADRPASVHLRRSRHHCR